MAKWKRKARHSMMITNCNRNSSFFEDEALRLRNVREDAPKTATCRTCFKHTTLEAFDYHYQVNGWRYGVCKDCQMKQDLNRK